MTSFELGLPSQIFLENCDSRSPRNLFDSDFDDDTIELRPSRPENELTRQLWFIVKDRMMNSFSKVCRDALSFHVKSEAEVLQLDCEIRQMYDNVPDVLRVKPLTESLAEEPFIIFTRIYVEFIYLKCLCVLHRRYMARGNTFSTTSCINAAKKIVSQFVEISKEFLPGGRLYMHHWMLTNYTMNDFLLGVMVLCFALHVCRDGSVQSRNIDVATQNQIRQLLESSYKVLLHKIDSCKDAHRVSRIVRLMLDGAKPIDRLVQSPQSVAQNIEPQQLPIPGQNEGESVTGPLEPFTFMNNPIGDIDWTMFDLQTFDYEPL